MMKKDGKEIYTFNGLINRMEACKLRTNRFTEKDIPEEVEFRGTVYQLNRRKDAYYVRDTGVSLATAVAKVYENDLFKYLTEHEFIVTPKEKIFLTSEEREFIRMCNAVLKGGVGIESLYISTDFFEKIITIKFKDGNHSTLFIPVGHEAFKGISVETEYTLKDLKIYADE